MHLTPRHLAAVAAVLLLVTAVAAAEAVTVLRLGQGATGPVHATPGQLIQVRLNFGDANVLSSDASIVKPIAGSTGGFATFYFVAALPGKALLRMTPLHRCTECLQSLAMFWAVEVDVV
jgi:hypothetical protein